MCLKGGQEEGKGREIERYFARIIDIILSKALQLPAYSVNIGLLLYRVMIGSKFISLLYTYAHIISYHTTNVAECKSKKIKPFKNFLLIWYAKNFSI